MKIWFFTIAVLAMTYIQALYSFFNLYIILSICFINFICLLFRYKKNQSISFLKYSCLILIITSIITIRSLNSNELVKKTKISGVVTSISDSKTQYRITIKDQNNHLALGIYYKQRPLQKQELNQITGTITKIKILKTQIHLTIENTSHKIWAIFYKGKRPFFPNELLTLKINDKITTQIQILKPLTLNQTYYRKKILDGYTHRASIKDLISINNQIKPSLNPPIQRKPIPQINIGDKVELVYKGEARIIDFQTKPKYLYANKVRYQGRIIEINIVEKVSLLPLKIKIKNELENLYSLSLFESVYNGLFLGNKKYDPHIKQLFFKNDVIAFLVVSGLHVNIIISFLTFFLVCLFFLFDMIILKPKALKIFFQTKRLVKQITSPFLFIPISIIVFYYLYILGFPQAATRAVFSFIIIGICSYYSIHTSYYSLLGFTIVLIFCIFPYFIASFIGLFYSFVAMLGIYSCLPIINYIRKETSLSRLSIFIMTQLFIAITVSLFILPTSLYYFHRYNFISILLNIPLSLLFVAVMYLGSFASIFLLISKWMSLFFLKIGDVFIQIIIFLLEWTKQFYSFTFYVKESPSIGVVITYYISLIAIMIIIQRLIKAPHIKVS